MIDPFALSLKDLLLEAAQAVRGQLNAGSEHRAALATALEARADTFVGFGVGYLLDQDTITKYKAALDAIGATRPFEIPGVVKQTLCLACGWDVNMCDSNQELGAKCSGQIARAALR